MEEQMIWIIAGSVVGLIFVISPCVFFVCKNLCKTREYQEETLPPCYKDKTYKFYAEKEEEEKKQGHLRLKDIPQEVVQSVLTKNTDYSPQIWQTYFHKSTNTHKTFQTYCGIIPTYNEEAQELMTTLESLHARCVELVENGAIMHVLVVLDGWEKTSDSMKEYINAMFPGMKEELDEIKPIEGEAYRCVETYILELIDVLTDEVQYVQVVPGKNLKLSVLVKRDNRRKHNSQAWFLEAFVPQHKPDFIFMTDCGTLYAENSLVRLHEEMMIDQSLSAATGKQCVMTAEMQGETECSLRSIFYRAAQGMDYALSTAAFNKSFELAGAQPVIPGPFGVYRRRDICDISARAKLSREILKEKTESSIHSEHHQSDMRSFEGVRLLADPSPVKRSAPPEVLLMGSLGIFSSSAEAQDRAQPQGQGATSPLARVGMQSIPSRFPSENVPSPEGQGTSINSFNSNVGLLRSGAIRASSPSASRARSVIIEEKRSSMEIFAEKLKEERLKKEYTEEKYIDVIDFYLQTASVNPDEANMTIALLALAEDRILSLAAAYKTTNPRRTRYVQSSRFFFQAETKALSLLQQRRRWINGTIAAYIWFMSNLGMVFGSRSSFFTKISAVFLTACQIMMYIIAGLGPAIIGSNTYYAILILFSNNSTYAYIGTWTYMAIYLLFAYFHSIQPTKENPTPLRLHQWLFDMITIINGIIAYILLVTLGYQAFWEIKSVIQSPSYLSSFSMSFTIIAIDMILPLVLAVLNDRHSAGEILRYFFPYLFLLPTFTAYFATYSYSRLWELTWGTRPSNSLLTMKKKKSPAEIAVIKENLSNNAKFIAYSIMTLNIILTFVITYFRSAANFLAYFCIAIFGWALIMMLISLAYFILEALISIKNFFWYRICHCGIRRRDYVTENYFQSVGNKKYKEEIYEIISEMIDGNVEVRVKN
jgi:Chitin synthase